MRRALLLIVATMLVVPTTASAEDWPASVRGLKVVVPAARGKRSYGGKRLTTALRKTLTEALGPLVSSRDLTKAQRKLKIRGKARYSDANLARAGQAVGAQWVLDVRVTKKKWLFTATARLINTETGEEQMNFRSQFYKPTKETKDRGFRIARKTIEKLDTLTRDGPLPAIGAVGDDGRPSSDPTAMTPPPDLTKDDVGTPPPVEDDPLATRLDDPPPGGSGSTGSGTASAFDPGSGSGSGSGSTSSGGASATTTVGPPPRDDDTELLRFSVTAGAGLLRTYDLSSDAVASSRLSYSLNPMSLVQADVEFILPSVPVTAVLKGAFRPVQYGVNIPNQDRATPSGMYLDASFMLGYHLALAGEGRQAFRLIPLVGARFGLNNAGNEAGDVLLSSTLLAVQAGVVGRMPINDVLELNVGAEGGWIASYSESPTTSGNSGTGFTVAGDLGARIWLSSAIAIAFDSRFTFEQIGFSGVPTRALPTSEQANLQNVTLATKDLRASIGVAFRL